MILPENCFLQNIKNIDDFNNLYGSEVLSSDFPCLKTSTASMASSASTTSVASMTFTASFHQKKSLLLMVGYPLATKRPIVVFFCGMDHQKPTFYLISVSFLSEAVEVSRYYFFENWLVILKNP